MPTVLVTGAARGIGRTVLDRLADSGWDVVAGVRKEADGDALVAAHPDRVSPVLLDVTDADHLGALDGALPERLDAVVNNAGIAVPGPVEAVPPDEWRRQLEVNVVGQVAVTQAVLPRLRESRGRVVFVSSINGRVALPLFGPYCASKFALEAVADALRMELRPWRIGVVVVQPAQTDTDIWRNADAMVAETVSALTEEQRRLYADHIEGMRSFVPLAQKVTVDPAHVASVVQKALTIRRPRPRYVVGTGPAVGVGLLTRLPTRRRDGLLRRATRQP